MATEKKGEKSRYHVLALTRPAMTTAATDAVTPSSRHAAFELVGEDLEANGAEHAKRLYAEKAGDSFEDAILVAVPSRSWNPTNVKVETKRTIRVG